MSNKLSFRVEGDWLANRIRDIWAGDNPVDAITILTESGMPSAMVQGFLAGKYTINAELNLVPAELPALLGPQATLDRLMKAFHEGYAQYQRATGLPDNEFEDDSLDADELQAQVNEQHGYIRALAAHFELPCLLPLSAPIDLAWHEYHQARKVAEQKDQQKSQARARATEFAPFFQGQGFNPKPGPHDLLPGLAASIGVDPEFLGLDAYLQDALLETPPIAPASLSSWNSGWIDREGQFYPCLNYQHNELNEELLRLRFPGAVVENREAFLEGRGWVKISMQRVYFSGPSIFDADALELGTMSQPQVQVLMEWLDARGVTEFLYNGTRVENRLLLIH